MSDGIDMQAHRYRHCRYRVIGFDGRQSHTLGEMIDYDRAVERAEVYVDDERFRNVKVEGQL